MVNKGESGLLSKEFVAGLISNIVGEANLKIDEPMKNHTSFKIGGTADIFVTPVGIKQLGEILNVCRDNEIPVLVIGNGTNLIVRDKGVRGVVVRISDNFDKYVIKNDIIEADAGILLSRLSDIALQHELSGIEFASGIPGTLGGAVAMNAGAYNREMKEVVIKTQYMDRNGIIKTIQGEQHQFGHRTSFVQKECGIVLKSEIQLQKSNKRKIKTLMDDLNTRRNEKQPLEMPSAGSIFKRPSGYYTGELIEKCGLKGYRIGGAEVSDKHCGFIINMGNATASDVINLIQYIMAKVKARYGIQLQTEVKIVGEE